jgi:hypothetical protein
VFEATLLEPVPFTNDGSTRFHDAYRGFEGGPSHAAWAELYSAPTQFLAETWGRAFEDTLVIGFEMPPSMRAVLSGNGIPYVDLMLHPARFMDDVFFCMRSNVAAINDAIRSHAMEERLLWRGAGAIKAFFSRRRLDVPEEAYTLYAAQTPVDRSMISEGRFLQPSDLEPGIRKTLGSRGLVCYKDHPLGSTPAIKEAVASCAAKVLPTKANVYAHLSSPSLEEIVSISSSVGTEAVYFGKKASFVIGPSTPVLYKGDEDDGSSYRSVYDAFLAPDFWRDILRPVIDTTAPDGDAPAHRSDLLRTTLGTFWGYNEIFCDTLVRQSSFHARLDDLAYAVRLMKAVNRAAESPVGRALRAVLRTVRPLAGARR